MEVKTQAQRGALLTTVMRAVKTILGDDAKGFVLLVHLGGESIIGSICTTKDGDAEELVYLASAAPGAAEGLLNGILAGRAELRTSKDPEPA